tara:strand:- start:13473 stop:15383 length:1911 start_codon:yes stop_codon:yes gene_type:complete
MSKIYLTILWALLCASIAHAQTTELATSDSLQLDQIVITASKIPLTQRETTKPVIVINRREIEQNGSRNLGQLLNQQSGIRVNDSFGSPANPQILYMQGASAQYTLILIDGLAVNDPSGSGGTFDLRLLPLNNVERIEILKGSHSTLYGTDAIAGVINIITREGSEDIFAGNGQISYGSFSTFEGSAGINGSINERIGYAFNYKRESSDGFSAAADPANPISTATFGDDGFNSSSFYGKIELKTLKGFTISPVLNFNDFDGDFDGGSFQDADNTFSLRMFNPGVQLKYSGNNLNLHGGYNYTKTDRSFVSQFGEDKFEGRFQNADLYGDYKLSESLNLLTGINYQEYKMLENGSDSDLNSQITSPYATLLLKNVNGFSAELGLRFNNHSEYGTNSTYSFSPSYNVSESVKLFGSITTGFKAPTLSELFGPFGANPELEPQTSRYLNFGVETYLLQQSLKIDLMYYVREIDNLIVYTFPEGFINRDRQNDNGFELSGNWLASNTLRIGAYYNYVTGELTTVDASGSEVQRDNLIRRPTHSVGVNAGLNVSEHFLVRVDGEYNSDRTDLFFNPENNFVSEEVTLDSYTLVNLYAEYKLLNNQLALFSEIRNLFDTDFTEIYGFNTAGISFKGGLRLVF